MSKHLGMRLGYTQCEALIRIIMIRELLEMRSRLYLNLGLVYENQADFKSARKFMVKALNTVK